VNDLLPVKMRLELFPVMALTVHANLYDTEAPKSTTTLSLSPSYSTTSSSHPSLAELNVDKDLLSIESRSDPWLNHYLRSHPPRFPITDPENMLPADSTDHQYSHGTSPRNYLDFLERYAAHIQDKEDEGLDKTYSFLVPMIVIIGIISLTIPVVAIIHLRYKNNSSGGSG